MRVPLPVLKDDYYQAMHWNPKTGALSQARARELGIASLLEGYLEA
ncbi:MAG: hypothetical protein IPI49_25395 [Myxococcales bacterium]|nr:hypothetical protein [Myxococcales bacterium]